MKEYIEPEVEIIEYLPDDIIAASTATTGQDGESSNGNGSGGGGEGGAPGGDAGGSGDGGGDGWDW